MGATAEGRILNDDLPAVLRGSAGADRLTGTDEAERILGLGGDDTLDGSGGNDALRGLDGDDVLDGGSGNDTMFGGVGADTMSGGTGNDRYYVDTTGDIVIELSGEGTADRVLSKVSYGLSEDAEIELLTTAMKAGTDAIDLTGNGFAPSNKF